MTQAANGRELLATIEARKVRAAALLAVLTAEVQTYGDGEPGSLVDWSHAGSMGHVVEQLENLADFLGVRS
jgi:hypothetical protein